jgi:hypothetical protein
MGSTPDRLSLLRGVGTDVLIANVCFLPKTVAAENDPLRTLAPRAWLDPLGHENGR